MCTLDRSGLCYDAKLTLCQLTVTLILCPLNQGFPPPARPVATSVRAPTPLLCLQLIAGLIHRADHLNR